MGQEKEVLSRLGSLEKIGIKLGLKNIQTLLQSLGNPQNAYSSILIAGTNGKGSVGAMLQTILSRHGFLTGHYSSPHLIDIRERIRVGGRDISEEDFLNELKNVFVRVDSLLESGMLQNVPTYFETLTAVAFHYFAKRGISFAVVEVGMGGRFDATNSVDPMISVITSIDYDHEAYLGRTLPEIAGEKAGIIKHHTPVITGLLSEEAMRPIAEKSEADASPLQSVAASDIAELTLEEGFPAFNYSPWKERVRINLRGKHQAGNAAIVMRSCDALKEMEVPLDHETIKEALNEVYWPGRLEIVSKDPVTLLDCAHNVMGATSLATFLEDTKWQQAIGLFTAMQDKRIVPMLQAISPKISKMFLTRVEPRTRCASTEALVQAAVAGNLPHEVEEDPIAAFHKAQDVARAEGRPLVVFGSIYLIGQILALTSMKL
jgi:dihydrofolate synthase / folylpolyglutamate synthase